jgi:hypothetical protein
MTHPLPNDGRTRMCVVCYTLTPRRHRPAVAMTYRGQAVCAEHETLPPAQVHAATIVNKPPNTNPRTSNVNKPRHK